MAFIGICQMTNYDEFRIIRFLPRSHIQDSCDDTQVACITPFPPAILQEVPKIKVKTP